MCSLWISIQMHWLSKYFSTPFLSQISNINVINHYSPNLASQWEDLCPKDFIFLVLKSLQSPESPFFFPSWVFLLFLLTGVLPKWLCWLILFVVWAGSLCGQEKEKGPPFLLNHNRSQVWSYSSGFIRKDAVFWCFYVLVCLVESSKFDLWFCWRFSGLFFEFCNSCEESDWFVTSVLTLFCWLICFSTDERIMLWMKA